MQRSISTQEIQLVCLWVGGIAALDAQLVKEMILYPLSKSVQHVKGN
jgi:hypothetical protein